jgi:hypothetical protein
MPPGSRPTRHHLVPRLKGGGRGPTVLLHRICHNAIHARFSEAELARSLNAIDTLRADPEIARFLTWIEARPPDFHAPTRRSRNKAGPRRGRMA